jgi:hypothetical protein
MKKEGIDGDDRKRTRDETYSGKYRTHVMKFEIWTTLYGVPFTTGADASDGSEFEFGDPPLSEP